MEMCHHTGADCDEVYRVLSHATQRILSPAYLRGGMGDGGACHPRDLIAMSWLAEKVQLSADVLGSLARAREAQTDWLARMVRDEARVTGLDVIILGKAYKAGSPLTDGSPALLLAHLLRNAYGIASTQWDPYVDPAASFDSCVGQAPAVFVVATRHREFPHLRYPAESVVIDPWGYMPDHEGVRVVRLGRKRPLAPAAVAHAEPSTFASLQV
jgi:UDPglucose 6-dehydrogenase